MPRSATKKPKKPTPVKKTSVVKKLTHNAHGHSHDGATLSANEDAVRKILSKSAKPLSAYDIIPLMGKQMAHNIAPATVYRALKTLTDHGIVTRIESRNAYMLCQHPHETHDCLFFICRSCGSATEAPDSAIRPLLRKEAATLGFGINKQILEIVGLCRDCSSP